MEKNNGKAVHEQFLICARGLRKKYGGTFALDGVDVDIVQGTICGVAGLNGAGKSTFLAILAGVLCPDGGEVLYRGEPVYGKKGFGRGRRGLRVGYVPQEIALFQDLSVYDNLKFWTLAAGRSGEKISLREHINNVAVAAGLSERLKSRVSALSGGMRRRVNIAAALVINPDVLIMDEPTAGLDAKNRRDILGFVRKLAKESDGKPAVICTSHQSGELELISDRLLLLDSGHVVYDGEPVKVFIGDRGEFDNIDDVLCALAEA